MLWSKENCLENLQIQIIMKLKKKVFGYIGNINENVREYKYTLHFLRNSCCNWTSYYQNMEYFN